MQGKDECKCVSNLVAFILVCWVYWIPVLRLHWDRTKRDLKKKKGWTVGKVQWEETWKCKSTKRWDSLTRRQNLECSPAFQGWACAASFLPAPPLQTRETSGPAQGRALGFEGQVLQQENLTTVWWLRSCQCSEAADQEWGWPAPTWNMFCKTHQHPNAEPSRVRKATKPGGGCSAW